MNRELFAREPLSVRDGIPVFSAASEYTDNYERISAEHLRAMREKGCSNPWISEDLWLEMETPTVDLVGKHSRPGQRILDVGSGLGRLLSYFPGLSRHGMDISFGYLERARAQGIEVCYSLVEDMPFKPDLFDVVVCTDVLEHVIDLNLACRRILSVLKPQGVLIVRVPFREDLSGYLAETYPFEYVHLRSFDEFSLRLLFEKVFHCQVVEMATAGYAASPSRLKYRLPVPLWDEALSLAANFSKRVNRRLHKVLLKSLYRPIEINIVVRKPS